MEKEELKTIANRIIEKTPGLNLGDVVLEIGDFLFKKVPDGFSHKKFLCDKITNFIRATVYTNGSEYLILVIDLGVFRGVVHR